MEIWKTAKGHSNYLVSDHDRVKKKSTGKILVSTYDSREYPAVTLIDSDGQHTKTVHRLVAETFIPNVLNKRTVNHIDGNKRNNHISNLEWNTSSENLKHAYAIGLKKRPDNSGNPKRRVMIIETGEIFNSIGECARAINGYQSHICNCLSGRYKTHKSYHFKYV